MVDITKNLPPSILFEDDIRKMVSLIMDILKDKDEKVNMTFYGPLIKGKFSGGEERLQANDLNVFLTRLRSQFGKTLGDFVMLAEGNSGKLMSVRLTKSDAKVRIRCGSNIGMEEMYSKLLNFFNERKNKLGWLRKDTTLLGYLAGIFVVFLAAIFLSSAIGILFRTAFLLSVVTAFLYAIIGGALIEKNPYTRMMLKGRTTDAGARYAK